MMTLPEPKNGVEAHLIGIFDDMQKRVKQIQQQVAELKHEEDLILDRFVNVYQLPLEELAKFSRLRAMKECRKQTGCGIKEAFEKFRDA
jgi:hypothetical protein